MPSSLQFLARPTHLSTLRSLLPPLFSSTLSTFLLSPLATLQTRLIAQPSHRVHRHFASANPFSNLRQLKTEEGGSWIGLYLHPTYVVPAVLDGALKAAIALLTPVVIEQVFGFNPVNNPLAYRAFEALLTIGSLILTLPVETARRRLQLQSTQTLPGGAATSLKTCVQTRPRPYAGVVDCVYRIVAEESVSGADGWFGGVKQLYRGFGLSLLATGSVIGLEGALWLMGGGEGLVGDGGEGWKEI
jgi:fusion and transport protein UGO1